jgi:hypothetical protein
MFLIYIEDTTLGKGGGIYLDSLNEGKIYFLDHKTTFITQSFDGFVTPNQQSKQCCVLHYY